MHSVLWNETEDTSSVKGSLDTEEHPYCYCSSRYYFPSCKWRASQVSDLTAFGDDASAKSVLPLQEKNKSLTKLTLFN